MEIDIISRLRRAVETETADAAVLSDRMVAVRYAERVHTMMDAIEVIQALQAAEKTQQPTHGVQHGHPGNV